MGLLKRLLKPAARGPAPLPSGSFTVDPNGEIITCTIPTSFSRDGLKDISKLVLRAFKEAKEAELALTELAVNFGAMKLKAREMRGGAMIFLAPRGPAQK
ncbi:MAG TPA: hypothetical protein VGR78_08150 [Verrucomicrobiae bacterium]|jgi:hypothetical protein|nr:hypothetical protein [Verrucomicrobiae bacterium]